MEFIVKLPANYLIDIDEQIEREQRFKRAFKSLIYKYSNHEVPFDPSTSFSVVYDETGSHVRLKTLSPQYPKEMQEEIIDTFSRVFIGLSKPSSAGNAAAVK